MQSSEQPVILILLTSTPSFIHNGKTRQTGFYWEELAVPYWTLRDAGMTVELASVLGGMPPADPESAKEGMTSEAVARFVSDRQAMDGLAASRSVAAIDPDDFDAIYLPGGHGTMWDLKQTSEVGSLVSAIFAKGGVVAAVCHGPAGLLGATAPDGRPLVAGRRVNGFTDAEEKAAGLENSVPYLLESELRRQGGLFECNPTPFGPYAVRDGQLVTGQNPASSGLVAERMIEAMSELTSAAA